MSFPPDVDYVENVIINGLTHSIRDLCMCLRDWMTEKGVCA